MMEITDTADDRGEQLFATSEHGSVNIVSSSSLALNVPVTSPALASGTTDASIPSALLHNTHLAENLSHMNSDYLKRRYRRRHENPEKIKELMSDSMVVVENLRTAIEGKMDAAAVGILQGILVAIEAGSGEYLENKEESNELLGSKDKDSAFVEDAGDRQRALYKANICPTLTTLLRELGGHPAVCEKALWCIAYLCRYSEQYKSSVCLENAKAFGVCGISDIIVSAVRKHNSSRNVLSSACDAIRSLCALESNRDRLGAAGACETLARALMKYMNNPEVICWICRAIGHLSNNHVNNLEILGSNGGCENIVLALQKYPANLQVCVECCYAIRNLALSPGNRTRLVRDFAPESILAVFKNHFGSDVFSIEACHGIVNMISNEADELINRVANGGFITYGIRSLRKNPDNDALARWVFQGMYYMACDERLLNKLITSEILDTLSLSLENHAGEESMAEWGCRFVEKILAQSSPHTIEMSVPIGEGQGTDTSKAKVAKDKEPELKVVSKGSQALYLATCAKLRTAGMCEMITSAVQRQAISAIVASIGSLCIGQLARDQNNQSRLSSAGACEAVVTALKRHSSHSDVCTNTCYSIYYLCKTVNNISWMGAYGACEGVCNAIKVYFDDPNVVRYASLAIAALAYKDEGNLERLQKSDVNNLLVSACSKHIGTNCYIAENMCHAISNLCLEPANVNSLGKFGACGLIVDILYQYASMHSVVTQALTAIAAMAIKQKTDKVHKGNTRKLVEKGALEVSIAVMQKFIEYEDVQRAGGLALTALARLEANKLQLSKNNACELIMHSLPLHAGNPLVVVKLINAVEALTSQCDVNIQKFSALNAIEILHQMLVKHENVHYVVESIYRALINMCLANAKNYIAVFNANTCKQIVKTLKLHEKRSKVAKWGCHLIYIGTVPIFMRSFGTSTKAGSESLSEKDRLRDQSKRQGENPTVDSSAIPQSALVETRKQFGLSKAPETLISIMLKYLTVGDGHGDSHDKNKDDRGSGAMNNMHSLYSYQSNSHIEVLIYDCMAIYALTLYEPNKIRFIDHDISAALVKTLLQFYQENILCEWILININALLLTSHQEKVRVGQQQVMKCIFNIVAMYSTATDENNTNIIRLVCDSIYELCLVTYNQQELININEGSRTIVDHLMILLETYRSNLGMLTGIYKAISSICTNHSKSSHKSKGSSLFGSTVQSSGSASNTEHVIANRFIDAGLAEVAVQALEENNQAAEFVQWVCATVVSLCSKNPRAQSVFVTHLQLIPKLTPLLVQYKQELACVTQIVRVFRGLVINSTENAQIIGKSSIILPTLLGLLKLHMNSDSLVEHVCYLLGNIEYKPSSLKSSKRQQSSDSIRELASSPSELDLPTSALSISDALANSEEQKVSQEEVMTVKAFYCAMEHYDLVSSVLQIHLNRNAVFSSVGSAPQSPGKFYNNNNVIRMIFMVITMFADKGRLHHANFCSILYNLICREAVLNNNDENLIQKLLISIGTLCKTNEENNHYFCVVNQLVEQLGLYIHEYKESSVVIYGVFFALIGVCEFNLQANQNKILANTSIIPHLIEIIYNDLETDFISQLGCVIISSITKRHAQNQLKCHNICNYIADILITHKGHLPITLECLKAVSTLAHACITNRNRMGNSDVCRAVCGVFTSSNLLDDDTSPANFYAKFPNNIYHWGVRSIGELAANHANNAIKLGSAGGCDILVKLLKRPSQNTGDYLAEMKLHSEIYWALGNLLAAIKEGDALAESSGAGATTTHGGNALASPGGMGKNAKDLMSSLNIHTQHRAVKNSTRLENLGFAEAFLLAFARALKYGDPSINRSNALDAVPIVTFQWAARLLVISTKASSRIRALLVDGEVIKLVDDALKVMRAASPSSGVHATLHRDALEWMVLAHDALSATVKTD